MHCSRVQNQLSAYCDHELTGAEMQALRRHLRDCDPCRQEHESVRRLKSLFGALPGVEPPDTFRPEMLARSRRRSWSNLAALLPTLKAARLPVFDGPRLVWAGALAIAVLCAALIQQPQRADAVTAHVPRELAADEAAPVYRRLPFARAAYPVEFPYAGTPLRAPASYRPGFPVTLAGYSSGWAAADGAQ